MTIDFHNRDSYKYPYRVSSDLDIYKWLKTLNFVTPLSNNKLPGKAANLVIILPNVKCCFGKTVKNL